MDSSDIDLSGKVALITGGGGGIGSAIALNMADMGANIAIIESIPERCEQITELVKQRGRKILALECNVMESDKLREALDAVKKHFGRIDILVNNAGGVAPRKFIDLRESSFRRHIELNLVSTVIASQEAAKLMIENGEGGSIINVSSIEGSRAAPNYAVYAACKAGVNNLTRTLAVELAEHDIRVNTLAPDMTDTPGLRGNLTGPVDESTWIQRSEAQVEGVRRRIPMGRPGIAEECGRVAVFLASNMASYVTGITLPVDGGTWASSGWVRSSNDQWILPPED
ncbi:MAG: SDR family oxidoreductase [Sphingomonadaceae bacterium]|nr:SDR family oxidoreductase [Sphingomonadaceae bacterium]